MVRTRGSDTLVSLIRRAQRLEQHERRQLQQHRGANSTTTSANTATSSKSKTYSENGVVSAASFYVPALPAASSSNLELAPMYSGHLPASYALDAESRDVMPDDAVSDAHLFFVSTA